MQLRNHVQNSSFVTSYGQYGSWYGVSGIKKKNLLMFLRVLNLTTWSLSQSVYVLICVIYFLMVLSLQQYHSHGSIYLVCSSNSWVCRRNPMVWSFKWLSRNGRQTRPKKTSRSEWNSPLKLMVLYSLHVPFLSPT